METDLVPDQQSREGVAGASGASGPGACPVLSPYLADCTIQQVVAMP
jgi:hypothetical protein